MAKPSARRIIVFLILTFAFSAVFYYLIAASGSIQSYSLGLMWCPGVAAILTQLIFQHSLRGLGWHPGRFKYLLAAYALPLAYALPVYGVVWLVGLGRFTPEAWARHIPASLAAAVSPGMAAAIYAAVMATLGLVLSSLSALGEEIGWRGLLVPELSRRLSFTATALVSGAIWALWHYPAILFSDYHTAGVPVGFALVCFTIIVVGMSFAFVWLRLRSGSLWTGVVLHASHNLFIQSLLTPATANTDLTPYIIDEFGVGLALTAIVAAYLFWRQRRQLPPATNGVS